MKEWKGNLSPEQAEVWNELCGQFTRLVIEGFRDARHITIMRELPPEVQLSAFYTGCIVGALTPMMSIIPPHTDATLAQQLGAAMPDMVAKARELFNEVK